jgi:uncharacterized Zn-finger protein
MVSQAPISNSGVELWCRTLVSNLGVSDAAKRGQMEPTEIIDVDSETVACDGGEAALGHPRVFLNMKGQGQIDCPYCGIRFVLKAGAAGAADATAGAGH